MSFRGLIEKQRRKMSNKTSISISWGARHLPRTHLVCFQFLLWEALTPTARPSVPSICSKNYNPFSSVTTHLSCPGQTVRSQNSSKTNEGGRSIRGARLVPGLKRAICGELLTLLSWEGGRPRASHGMGHTKQSSMGHTHLITNHQWPSLLAAHSHLGRASQMTKTHNGERANICILEFLFLLNVCTSEWEDRGNVSVSE